MKALVLAALVLLGALAYLPTAEATQIGASCAHAIRDTGLGTRTFLVSTVNDATTTCTTSTPTLSIPSGTSVTLYCRQSTSGTVPDNADIVRVQAYSDIDGGQVWARDFSTSGCSPAETMEFRCTSNGLSTGTAYTGQFKIRLFVQRTTATTYQVNSDSNGNSGTIKCLGGDDPLTIAATYDYENDKVVVGIAAKLTSGTARTGLAASITVALYKPDGTAYAHGGSLAELATTGTYRMAVALNSPLTKGVWTATASVAQPSSSDLITAITTFDVGPDLDALLAALEAHLDGIDADNAALTAAVEAHETEFENYRTEARTWRAFDNLSAREATLTAARTALEADHDTQDTAHATAATAHTTAATAHGELATDHDGLATDHDALDAKIQDSNNTASGALSYATWLAHRDGEARAMWRRINDTALETTVTKVTNDTTMALDGLDEQEAARHDELLSFMPTHWAAVAWDEAQPREQEHWILAAIIGVLILGAFVVRGPDGQPRGWSLKQARRAMAARSWRRGTLGAAGMLFAAYLHVVGVLPKVLGWLAAL